MGTDSLTSDEVQLEVFSETAESLRPRQIAVFEPSPFPLKYPAGIDAGPGAAARGPRQTQTTPFFSAVKRTLRTKWFWYAMASSLCWTGWAFTAKIGSREVLPTTMEFI